MSLAAGVFAVAIECIHGLLSHTLQNLLLVNFYITPFQVSWVDHHYIPLSYEDRRVVDDHRFSIVRPYIKEWNLQIRDVSWQDQGQYRCTVNTDPVKSKMVMLHVKGNLTYLID